MKSAIATTAMQCASERGTLMLRKRVFVENRRSVLPTARFVMIEQHQQHHQQHQQKHQQQQQQIGRFYRAPK